MTTLHSPHDTAADHPETSRRWLVLTLLATAQLMLVLDVTVVTVALPDIGADLGLSQAMIPWVLTTYTLCFGGLILLGGRLSDLFGARRILLGGLTLFTGASLACGLASSSDLLLAGRAAQGVGAALLSPAALGLVTVTFTGSDRTKALAVWGALSGAGTALGVVLGGVLTSAFGWPWIFAVNVPIGLLILAVGAQVFPVAPPAARRERLDVPGAALVTAGTAAAIYGLVNAGTDGWGAASTLLSLGAAVGLWTAFALVERATAQPLLRVGLLLERPVAAGAFLMLVATGLMVGGFFLGSFALQRAHGFGAGQVGLCFLPVAVAVVLGAHLAGRLLTHLPARAVAASGLVLAAGGNALAATTSGAVPLVTGLAVGALGIGATFVTAFGAALSDATPHDAGLRSAVVSTFHELGGAFGVAVLATVAGSALVSARPDVSAFGGAFTVAAFVAAVGAVVAAVLVPSVSPAATGHGHGHH